MRGASRLSPAGKRCRVQRLPEVVKGQEIGWNSFSGWVLSPPPMESRGEVKVFPTTDDVNRYKDLKEVFLDTGKGRILMELEQVKFHKNMVIVKFKGYDNINDIEMYKGKDLLISREHAVSLAPDENFIIDLIGLKVVTDEGKDFGTVKDILQTGANDVYMIDGNDGKEYLFPSIKECILDVNLEEGKVTVPYPGRPSGPVRSILFMNFHILTLFPEMVTGGLNTSITGRAMEKGLISVEAVNIRDYSTDKHRHVDDYPTAAEPAW